MKMIITGNNQMIKYLCRQYISKGYHIIIIEKNPDKARVLSIETKGMVFLGDITEPAILREAGAQTTDILVCVTSNDTINYSACQTGKVLFGIPTVFALVNTPSNYETFRQTGITGVFNQSDLLLQEVIKTQDNDLMRNLHSYTNNLFQLVELRIKKGMPAYGLEIVALGLPREANIVNIIRNGKIEYPDRNYILTEGDRVILSVTPSALAESAHLILGSYA
ncbi:MAG: TrkA family potassium uptake protein [Firmicutes bacterium]|nr:TrkA family potassium uptake protein [Bacillota bacterium]